MYSHLKIFLFKRAKQISIKIYQSQTMFYALLENYITFLIIQIYKYIYIYI